MADVSFTLNLSAFSLAGPMATIRNRAAQALYRFGERVMALSKERFCPVDTGALRSTGHVTLPQSDGRFVVVKLAYGGPASPYAAIVHERLDLHHPHGSAKYLERPLLQLLAQAGPAIAAAVEHG